MKLEDEENSIMENFEEMNNDDKIIGILFGVSILCGIVIVTLLLMIVIHSIKSRSVSSMVMRLSSDSLYNLLNCQVNTLMSWMCHYQTKQLSMFCNTVLQYKHFSVTIENKNYIYLCKSFLFAKVTL